MHLGNQSLLQRIENISFIDLIGNDGWYFWGVEMHDEYGFGRYSVWNQHPHWPKKRWDKSAEDLCFYLANKYGVPVPQGAHLMWTTANAKIRQRCREAKKNFEKNQYYWGTK